MQITQITFPGRVRKFQIGWLMVTFLMSHLGLPVMEASDSVWGLLFVSF